ncbi:MAG: SCP2 sterol-binding domain-containing protein [Alcanivoracaceae bacterium]|nr:SCP2 sterol-binding domain-containing protein [Alcanivoracaceae bacterium]
MSLKDQATPPGLFETAFMAGVERLINRALQSDPASLHRLADHSGQLLAVELTFPATQLFILVVEDGIEIYHASDATPDVILRGGAVDLAAEFLGWRSRRGLIGGPVSIQGDRELLQSVADIARDLELDWGAMLEPVLGSEVAAQLDLGARRLADLARDGFQRLGRELSHRLQQDNPLLALRRDVYEFNQDVDELREDVDRLSLRVARLQSAPADPDKES